MRGRGGGSVTAGRGGGSLTAGRRAADRELPPLTAARPARRPRSAPLPGLLEAGPGADSRLQSGAARRPRGTRRRSAPRGLPGSFPVSSGRGGGGGGGDVKSEFPLLRCGRGGSAWRAGVGYMWGCFVTRRGVGRALWLCAVRPLPLTNHALEIALPLHFRCRF